MQHPGSSPSSPHNASQSARVRRPLPASRPAGPAALKAVPTGGKSLADRRGYLRQDLYAVAEIAHHYLFSGGHQIALALFEGLTAVAPDEAYFALGLALAFDHAGDVEAAEKWYGRAGELDPRDGRPDVNLAELSLARRDFRRARDLLARAAQKARARRDEQLERKALALLGHIRGR